MKLTATQILEIFTGRSLSMAMLMTILLAGLISNDASGENPTAVSLIYFRGHGQDGAVVLEWATATELDTVGFEVERATFRGGPYQRLSNIGFVPSLADDSFSGAEYDVVDEDGVTNGQNYYYILVEIEFTGGENKTEPIVVTAGEVQARSTATTTIAQPTATSTPGNTNGTSQPTPTNTPTVQATARTSSTTEQNTGSASGAAASGTPLSRSSDQSNNSTTNVASANSDSSGSGNSSLSNVGQAQPTGEGYPDPLVTPILSGSELPYPSGAPDSIEQPFEVNPSAYPGVAPENIPSPGAPSFGTAPAIGSDFTPSIAEDSDSATDTASDPVVSTLVLWIGFITAMLIFALGIIGAIYWYTRQRTG